MSEGVTISTSPEVSAEQFVATRVRLERIFGQRCFGLTRAERGAIKVHLSKGRLPNLPTLLECPVGARSHTSESFQVDFKDTGSVFHITTHHPNSMIGLIELAHKNNGAQAVSS